MLFARWLSLVPLSHLAFVDKLLGVFCIFRILAFVDFTMGKYSLFNLALFCYWFFERILSWFIFFIPFFPEYFTF